MPCTRSAMSAVCCSRYSSLALLFLNICSYPAQPRAAREKASQKGEGVSARVKGSGRTRDGETDDRPSKQPWVKHGVQLSAEWMYSQELQVFASVLCCSR